MSRVRAQQATLAIPDNPEEIHPSENVKIQLSKLRNNFNMLWSKYSYITSNNGYFTPEFFTSILSERLPITFENAENNQAVFTSDGGELVSRKITGQGKVVMDHNPYGHGIWTIPHIRNLNNDLILQEDGLQDIDCFGASAAGSTPAFTISGYRAADALRTLSVSVGAGAADRVDFTGLTTYYFGGAITATGGIVPGGNITMADDEWIGLGAAAGRLAFDSTPATDLLDFMSCDVRIAGDLTVTGDNILDSGGTWISSDGSGKSTFAGDIIIPNDGYVGSVDNPTSLKFQADGDIIFSKDMLINANIDVRQSLVANANNLDYDTIIHGTVQNMFYLDAGNNRIGIGTATPSQTIEIERTGNNAILIDSAGHSQLILDKGAASNQGYVQYWTAGSVKWKVGTPDSDDYGAGDEFIIAMDATDPDLVIDTSGNTALGGTLTLDLTQDYLFTASGTTLAVQSQTSGNGGVLRLFSNDGDGTDNVAFEAWGVGTPGAIDNRERMVIGWQQATAQYEIFTEAHGTGTLRPLVLFTEGSAQLKLTTAGNIEMGGNLDVNTTGEVTCGSINRAAGTLTLEIGGTPEISITSTVSTFGGNILIPSGGYVGSAGDNTALQIDANGNVIGEFVMPTSQPANPLGSSFWYDSAYDIFYIYNNNTHVWDYVALTAG